MLIYTIFLRLGGINLDFNIITLGCKVNQYESQAMSENLQSNGYSLSDDKDHADITIINSCTVTSVSDSKNKKLIRRVKRNNPNGVIILTGCMPQAFPDDYNSFECCDIVLGNASRSDIIPAIETFLLNRKQIISIKKHKAKNDTFEKMSVSNFNERTRAFVKIEDGCNRFCSYCIIPFARGRVRSKPIEQLKEEVESLAINGYKEIVLVGINLSAYGQDLGLHLCDAVECVCSVDKIQRVRLGSIEPEMLNTEAINRLSKLKKLCPQFHLSLQSGCDNTLKHMNRHYDTAEYSRIVADLRTAFNNSAITTDIMVGFPGETQQDFNESVAFAKEIGFAKVHVFPYSRRKGTVADKADNQIDESIKDERSKIMISETNKLRNNFLLSQVNLTEEVLFETMRHDGYCEGYTKNYTPVHVKSEVDYSGKILTVKITDATNEFCIGELCN